MNDYMISPLSLSERQLLIYRCLYKKCDFRTMEVSYTTQQIITDIKIVDLTVRIVNAEIKQLEEKGHLKIVKRGTKGNCSIYKIIKNTEKDGNLSVTNTKVNGNLKDSNSNTSNGEKVTNTKVNGKLSVSPIKEKEKENNKKEKVTSLDKIILDYTGNEELIEAIKDFIKMRKTIKKAVTDRALKGILTKLDKFGNSDFEKISILENSIENCWVSVYELKNKKEPTAIDPGENTSANSVRNNKNFNTRFKGEFL